MQVIAPSLKIFLGSIILILILTFGKTFFIPFAFGTLFAILFTPLHYWLLHKGFSSILAIGSCVLVLLFTLGLFIGGVIWQSNILAQDWPKIEEQLQQKYESVKIWAIDNFDAISESRIDHYKEELANQQGIYRTWITNSMGGILDTLTNSIIVLMYMIFLMMISQRFTQFTIRTFPDFTKDKIIDILLASRTIVFNYFWGRSLLAISQCIFYSLGFFFFDLKYSLAIGILAGLLSFIPYIGNIIGGVLALLISIATGGDSTQLLGIIGTMSLGQVLENNILQPYIMSQEVNLNPFFTFTSVVGFSIIWGVAGSVLAIPIIAVLKVIFDRTEEYQTFGYLMGSQKE